MKKFLFLFLLIYSNLSISMNIDNPINLLTDLPGKQIKKIVFFLGDESIIQTQTNIIKEFSNVEFTLLVSSLLNNKKELILKEYKYKNVNIKFLNYPVTNWTQDRLLRSENNVTGVLSEHNFDGFSIYEAIAANEINKIFNFSKDSYSTDLYVSQYTGKDPFITNNKNNNLLKLNKSNLFYGDGGDKIVTDKYIFLGGNSFNKSNDLNNLKSSELIFNKKILSIDNDEINRYAFHLDLYLTFINDNTVIFGSYQESLIQLPNNLDWVDYNFMKRKINNENKIIDTLKNLNFKIIKIPLIYKKDSGYITFNNGIYNGNNFYTSNYNFDENINNYLDKIKLEIKNKFLSENINVNFINGGEKNILLGGQIRCTTAIIE